MDELRRIIGFPTAAFLVIASMIGTGIFTSSGFMIASLHHPWIMLLCWGIGGLFALSGALCYGELGAMFPHAGGDYVYLREGFGKMPAFLSGWISLIVGFSAPIAAAAIASATYFFGSLPETWFPHPEASLLASDLIRVTPVSIFAGGMILLFSLVHLYSLTFGGRIQNLLTVLKIVVILFFVFAGLFFGQGSVDHFTAPAGGRLFTTGGFVNSLVFVTFAYSGWNAAAYIGGEIHNPSRNIPLSLLAGTLLVMVLYLLLNLLFIYALSVDEMSGVIEIGAKSAMALFGRQVGKLFSAAVMVCILSMISAMVMSGPRVYYAMAKDRSFFPYFGRVSRSRGTPVPSILLQGAIALFLVLTSTFDKLLLYVGFTLSIFSMLTVLGMMRLRQRRPLAQRTYRTLGYPVTPLFFVLGNLSIIAFSIRENPAISFYGSGTIAMGMLLYFCFHRYDRGKELKEKRGG